MSRREAFWTVCEPHSEPWVEDDAKWEWLREAGHNHKCFMVFLEVVCIGLMGRMIGWMRERGERGGNGWELGGSWVGNKSNRC